MAGGAIFISYRRSDSQWAASRLSDTLGQAFPDDPIFMDVDSIDPGQDFVRVLEQKIAECDVFLALIGPRWLTETNADGRRRVDDPEDFVRLEIAGALARADTVTIPVLLDGAMVPEECDLPEPLRPLARRQFARLSHEGYRTEVERLVEAIGRAIGRAPHDRRPADRTAPAARSRPPGPRIPGRLRRLALPLAGAALLAALAAGAWHWRMQQTEDFSGRADLSTFRECEGCPEMVVIPAGSFTMGSPPDEAERRPQEGPQTEIRIARFALARTELTFAEWDACTADGGCNGYTPPDDGTGRGPVPASDLSWNDAQRYIAWLNSKVPGTPYRLPSEAEWEYAARAGTTTPYYWGMAPDRAHANMGREICCIGAAEGADEWVGVAPVAQFPANAFGLHDMAGNLSEWVADIYRDSHEGVPTDGRPRPATSVGSAPDRYVLRGGSFKDRPWQVRSAMRFSNTPDWRLDTYGFRVARDLDGE